MSLLNRFFTAPAYIAVFFTALTISSLPACSDDSNMTPEQRIIRADDYKESGNTEAAIIELKNALIKNPDNIEVRWLLGKYYIEVGDGPAAEKELRRATELGLAPEAAAIPLARALLQQGNFLEVINNPVKPESLPESDQAELWALGGHAYLGMGKVDLAEKSYDTAASINADSPDAGFGKALVAFARNKPDIAREHIAKVLQTTPGFGPAWGLLGDIEVREKELEKAEEMFSKAIQLNKYLTQDRVKRAEVRLQQGNFDGAREDIDFFKKQGVSSPDMYFIEGRIHFQEKNYADAQLAFDQALALNPASTSIKVYLAASHMALGHTQQALALAEQINALHPGSAAAKHLFASAHFSASEFALAKTALDEILVKSPNDIQALTLMGNIALMEGRAIDGVEYFSRAVALSPESTDLKQQLAVAKLMAGEDLDQPPPSGLSYEDDFLLALAKLKQGDTRQAYEMAKALHDNNPDKIDPLNLMAACHVALGESSQARAQLEKVLQMDPRNPSATLNLAKLDIQAGDTARAREQLTKFLDEVPGNIQAALLLANIEAQLGNNENVIRILEQAVERHPEQLSLRTMLAQAYYNTGRLENLLTLTRDTTTEQYREQPLLLELRGKAHIQTGDIPAANRDFRQWTDIEPDSARAHFMYSDSLARSGLPEQGREELKRAIQLDPNYLSARIGEIKSLVQTNELEDAQAALTRLKQDFGDQPAVTGIEGWFALGMHDYPAAEKSLSHALEKQPDAELTVLLSRALWGQRKHEEALQVMRDWLEDHPQDFQVQLELANGYMALEREAEAREAYARVIDLSPNHVPTLNNLAWLSQDQDLKQAITYAERAHELAPGEAKVADTLGTLLLKKGDSRRGYEMVQKAAALSPGDPEIQLHFARTLVEQKKLAEARTVLNAVVANHSGSEFSREADTLLKSLPQ